MWFDRYISQTPIKNLHLSKTSIFPDQNQIRSTKYLVGLFLDQGFFKQKVVTRISVDTIHKVIILHMYVYGSNNNQWWMVHITQRARCVPQRAGAQRAFPQRAEIIITKICTKQIAITINSNENN
jgi:hypothetical protein